MLPGLLKNGTAACSPWSSQLTRTALTSHIWAGGLCRRHATERSNGAGDALSRSSIFFCLFLRQSAKTLRQIFPLGRHMAIRPAAWRMKTAADQAPNSRWIKIRICTGMEPALAACISQIQLMNCSLTWKSGAASVTDELQSLHAQRAQNCERKALPIMSMESGIKLQSLAD